MHLGWLDDIAARVSGAPWLVPTAAAVAVLVVIALLARRRRARPGEVWFAKVPFDDASGAKDRPVIVLTTGRLTCSVAPLTSRDKTGRRGYARAPDGLPGLSRASWVRLEPVTLSTSALRRRAGDPGEAILLWFDRISRQG